MGNINVAIDGPSGAGKSTIARTAAARLGFIYVDTGAIYRTVAVYADRNGVGLENAADVVALLPEISVALKYIDGEQRVLLNGEDVSTQIREHRISALTSACSAVKEVRAFLLDIQRDIAAKNNVIMDGRDIGTVVLPNAQVKIFLTASPEIRAERRYKELVEKGESVSYEKILEDVKQRDFNDSTRAEAPLRQADDAVLADTSNMTLEESIDMIINMIKEQM